VITDVGQNQFRSVPYFSKGFRIMAAPNVPSRPPVVPPRPAVGGPPRPPVAGVAAPQVAASVTPPVAPVVPPVAPVVPPVAPVDPSAITPNSAAPGATSEATTGAPAVAGTRRRRKKGTGGAGRPAKSLETYYGVFGWKDDGNGGMVAELVDDGNGGQTAKRVKLESIPTDFDANKHEKLRPADFADEANYWEFRAAQLVKESEACKVKAAKLRTLGNVQTRTAASKLMKVRQQMADLMAQLRAAGVPEDQLAAFDKPDCNAAG
jgi:hypothetical protein